VRHDRPRQHVRRDHVLQTMKAKGSSRLSDAKLISRSAAAKIERGRRSQARKEIII
jgi:hypothetical protein